MISALTSQHFAVAQGRNGKVLKLNMPGNVLVFFKTLQCPGCSELEPHFSALASKDHRVSYCIMDVGDYRDVILWARDTSTPIQSVPMLLLYCNQFPKAKYTGAKNLPSLQSFLTKALQTSTVSPGPVSQTAAMTPLASPTQFMPQPQALPQMGPGMSGYALPPGGNMPPGGRVYQPDFAAGGGPTVNPRGRAGANPQNVAIPSAMQFNGVGGVEDDDDSNLLTPSTVIPHNTPWEIEMRR